MASIQPPTAANLKRKRVASLSPGPLTSSQPVIPAHLRDTINPRSHSRSTLRQLQLAGLSDKDVLPSDLVPGFPHRPLPADPAAREEARFETDDDPNDSDNNEAEDPAQAALRRASRLERGVRRAQRAHERNLGVLTAVLHRSLDAGDVPRAKRAFGLLARSEVNGKPVDLRQDHLWAIGAEILMREGEGENEGEEADDASGAGRQRRRRRRWGSAANMPRVRAYYQDLIQHHPYNRLWPRVASALDFWPALLGTEVYSAWAEHGLALRRLEAEAEEWLGSDGQAAEYAEEGRASDEHGSADREARVGPWEAKLRDGKENIRVEILGVIKDVARRMDGLMEAAPYSTSHEMLRLRGMVALYHADLSVSLTPGSAREEREGRMHREDERERAKDMFRKIMEDRGEVEEWIEYFVYPERQVDEDEDALPVFSSLPIRELSG